MHAARLVVLQKPPPRVGPQIRGRRAEDALVAAQRLGILGEIAMPLRSPAGRGPVMERAAEHLGAEALPIVAGIGEVQVPGLVDLVRGRDGMIGRHREEAEAPILLDHALGLGAGPAILARQPRREAQLRILGTDGVMGKRHPDRVAGGGSRQTGGLAHLNSH